MEEKYIIDNYETPAANKLGEPTRKNHAGKAYPTQGPTTTKNKKQMNKIFFILIITVQIGHSTVAVEGMYSNREALWKVSRVDSIPKTSELTYKHLPRKIKRKIRKYNHKFDRFLQRSMEDVKFCFLEARENNKYIFVLFQHNNGRVSHFDLFVFNKTSSSKFSYHVYEFEGESMMKETIIERYYKKKLKTSICTF